MTRWEPAAEERLRRAAVDLFVERGYDEVTVSEIAAHAGLTRRSFFRYFPDKREVLFAGSSQLVEEIERRLRTMAPDTSAVVALHDVLAEAGTFLLADRSAQSQRRAIIATSAELQERDRAKRASIGATIAESLIHRGTSPEDAGLLGAIWAEVFRSAYDRALSDDASLEFGEHLRSALRVAESFPAPFVL